MTIQPINCLLIFLTGLVIATPPLMTQAQGNKPPDTGNLFSFEGTLDLGQIKEEKGTAVSIAQMKEGGRTAIRVDFPESDGYPGINFPVPPGGWDLSGYGGVQVDVANPGKENVSVYLRIDNDGDWEKNPWNTEVLRLNPGETKPLKVLFGKSFGNDGFDLDPSRVTGIKFYTDPTAAPFSVLISGLQAFKSSGKAAKSTGKAPEGASRPYVTTTVSPKNHNVPYGQDWELVKDWTFGKNRPDATIRNRAELDKEFFYRYIYEKGKLDTLSTYWTVHRDYPEEDPKSVHVFGDDTLTLKARIPEGGGLWKGGIESGMLRSKLSVEPGGIYIEMRAKLTKGIGAWPAFWLGAGVQHPDGTFSDLPWPPEIDIFEFYNWQGRAKTRELSINYQVNNKPEKFGNPYTIFSALREDNFYVPGMDFSEDFHVFALDWRDKDRPMWVIDGHPIKQAYYEWNGPAAHILVTNQLGIEFAKPAMKEMTAVESNWDYVIDYIRVWKLKSPK